VTAYVTTFYSFKGGVGRTTLLVNVANVLAARGERVLIWDLDLEAPGVHHFPGLEPPEQVWQSGFLEWLGQTPPCPTIEPTAAWPPEVWMRTLGDRVYETRGPRGRIFVLPAHGTNANLGRAYGSIDWHGLFVDLPTHGLHLFSRVRDMLIDRFEPTFLFIDSRTGISDLGGFLTGFLPDCTILVGNYSRQSTEGLRGVYLALDRFATERVKAETHRTRKLERVLVASPVPLSLPARERGRKRWLDGFSGEAPRSLIEVPLVENLLYAEDVLVRSAPSSDAARAYQAVGEILAGLRQVRERTEQTSRFSTATLRGASRLERLLTLLGYETGKGSGSGLVVRQRTLAGAVTHRIEYIDGTVRSDAAFRERLERLRATASPGVATLIIADAARDDARDAARAAGLALRTIAELEDELVDLRACAAAVRRTFEDSELSRVYVAPYAVTSDGKTVDGLEHALRWIAGAGPRLMLVRGDPGSGKTGFLRRLAYELALRAEAEPTAPTPILIELRGAAAGATLETLLQQQLRAAIGWHGNPEAILYLLNSGRVILLLDGFDETAVSSRDGAEEQLRLLTHPTEHTGMTASSNRMIVASRLDTQVDAVVLDLSPFNHEQVERFFRNRLGRERAQLAYDKVMADPPSSAKSIPMFLELLASDTAASSREGGAWAAAEAGLKPAALFERHVEHWIAGEASDALLPIQRARLVERLAAELWKVSAGELPQAQLVAAVRANEPQLAELDTEQLDMVLRSAPFVTRSEVGAYGFSHRSILEYVLARHLLRRAQLGVDALRAALATERLDASCTALFVDLAAQQATVRDAIRQIVDGPYTPDATENAVRLAAAFEARHSPTGGGRR
jgi:NACHT domain/CobQ/CobB/MinD/ParA nucleotide binding domain